MMIYMLCLVLLHGVVALAHLDALEPPPPVVFVRRRKESS